VAQILAKATSMGFPPPFTKAKFILRVITSLNIRENKENYKTIDLLPEFPSKNFFVRLVMSPTIL